MLRSVKRHNILNCNVFFIHLFIFTFISPFNAKEHLSNYHSIHSFFHPPNQSLISSHFLFSPAIFSSNQYILLCHFIASLSYSSYSHVILYVKFLFLFHFYISPSIPFILIFFIHLFSHSYSPIILFPYSLQMVAFYGIYVK